MYRNVRKDGRLYGEVLVSSPQDLFSAFGPLDHRVIRSSPEKCIIRVWRFYTISTVTSQKYSEHEVGIRNDKNRLKIRIISFLRDLENYPTLTALTVWITQLSEE